MVFVDGFDGNEFVGEQMEGQVDFTKGSFTKDFPDAVEVKGRSEGLMGQEGTSDLGNEVLGGRNMGFGDGLKLRCFWGLSKGREGF